MKYPILFFSFILLNGCVAPNQIDKSSISRLSNDDLCRALGEFNRDGVSVLAIHHEIEKRAPGVDAERCLALEKSVISGGAYQPCSTHDSAHCLPANKPLAIPKEIYDQFGVNHRDSKK